MNYVDLFSGAGGLSLGFEEQGFENVFAIEIDKNASETYKYNFPNNKLISKDITTISNDVIKKISGGDRS